MSESGAVERWLLAYDDAGDFLLHFARAHDAEDEALREALVEALNNCTIENHAGSDDYACAFCRKARAALEGRAPAPSAKDEAFRQMLIVLRRVAARDHERHGYADHRADPEEDRLSMLTSFNRCLDAFCTALRTAIAAAEAVGP